MYPEEVYRDYQHWKNLRPNWNISEICFRMVFVQVTTALAFAVVVGGLKMGCTQILINLVYYVTDPSSTE